MAFPARVRFSAVVALLLLVAFCLYVPYEASVGGFGPVFIGYASLFEPPGRQEAAQRVLGGPPTQNAVQLTHVEIDWSRFAVGVAAVVAVAAAVLIAIGRTGPKPGHPYSPIDARI